MGLAVLVAGCSRESDVDVEAKLPFAQRTEEGWVVRSVAVDLIRLAAYSVARAPLEPAEIQVTHVEEASPIPVYRVDFAVDGASRSVELEISTYPLDPAAYEPLGRILGAAYPLHADGADYAPQAAEALAAFSVAALRAENERISGFLSAHPGHARAHEDAAVLLGVFALRDNAGRFWNPLSACARATAHLALARALGSGERPDADALLAEILLESIVDAKAACAAQIEVLQGLGSSRPALRPWVSAARFRNTRDWRAAAGDSFVEEVEKFRALCDAAGTGPGVKYLLELQPEATTDWARIALETSWSVGDGHRFTEGMVGAEVAEAVKVLGRPAPQDVADMKALVAVLNTPPAPAVLNTTGGKNTLRVIDEAMWCGNAQRHLGHAVYETWYFLAEMWGVPEDAGQFWRQTEAYLAGLDLFPAVALLRAETPEEIRPYAGRLAALFARQPESIPDAVWAKAASPRDAGFFPGLGPAAAEWFTPPVLTGTAYRFAARCNQLVNFHNPTLAQLEPLYRAAPLQQSVVIQYLHRQLEGRATEAELRTVAGPLLDYSLPVIRFAGRYCAKDPAVREKLLRTGAGISPDDADDLAKFYLAQHRPDEAAAAWQAYVDGATDRVSASNQCQWLVDYYYERGRKGEALKVARMAAEVYSSKGLKTCASLLERLGDLAGAEQNHQHVAERYEDGAELYLFYRRHVGEGDWGAKAKEIESRFFPAGMVPMKLASASGKPQRGVLIRGNSPRLRQNGLRPGDVIVAIEGTRVETFEQYLFVRSLSDSPAFRLIVYQDGAYREIMANAPQRRLEADMVTLR